MSFWTGNLYLFQDFLQLHPCNPHSQRSHSKASFPQSFLWQSPFCFHHIPGFPADYQLSAPEKMRNCTRAKLKRGPAFPETQQSGFVNSKIDWTESYWKGKSNTADQNLALVSLIVSFGQPGSLVLTCHLRRPINSKNQRHWLSDHKDMWDNSRFAANNLRGEVCLVYLSFRLKRETCWAWRLLQSPERHRRWSIVSPEIRPVFFFPIVFVLCAPKLIFVSHMGVGEQLLKTADEIQGEMKKTKTKLVLRHYLPVIDTWRAVH